MLFNYKIPLVLLSLGLISCKKQLPPQKINTFYKEVITPADRQTITVEEAKTYHTNTTHQYEYRTGKPGHYEYNYDVKGINTEGDSVFGNINIEGKYGAGILTNDSIPVIEIKAEWVHYGKLKAVDQHGNYYQLVVR
ncbi:MULTISPECIES: hypothetical protein [Flavobacterium]|uniref:Uncharacterized protein n=2 Tax=Flavobacterium TaxID=237 RepID=A0A940XA32_9FLAO|nr:MULTISPECIES: hypothetical protein [Flavobacterium]MBP4138592.1 hypothetical protein [Flavobacterium geliluteum]MDX6183439.1 hypothetical protein [Flavobacterium sp. Fl-33]MDX6186723.1 hypothetical protein [Flavobacterium sp. Fl-77]UFH38509.1 hypothetical protein LNP22_17505 [Flavobacterium sp. F-70]